MNNSKNVPFYLFGKGCLKEVPQAISHRRNKERENCIFFVDHFFREGEVTSDLHLQDQDMLFFVSTEEEPTTSGINSLYQEIIQAKATLPAAVIGMGDGCTLDTAKAISNLLTNGGKAEDYQGWDLVKVPGVYKIGIPTISGTGAETSRTCVMMNRAKNLKLGMNSEYTIYDQLILDPELPATVPRDQYFFTGMDTYIHCIESLGGRFRHPIGDAFSHQALSLSRQVFGSDDMKTEENREKLMVASYLGGCAIANSFVGLIHPLSAGLSIVLGIHHCMGNCLVMNAMEDFYPEETEEFHQFLTKQNITLPRNVTAHLSEMDFNQLFDSSIIHEKPLANALGENFRSVLTRDKVREIFKKI
jgi:3-deoxy-alpha-D-manno-octulosonate 8-oxidase